LTEIHHIRNYRRAGGVDQAEECLLSKCEILSSNSNTAKKKKKKKREIIRRKRRKKEERRIVGPGCSSVVKHLPSM
jgi:hypothetical protein